MHGHGVFRIFHSGCQLAGDNFTNNWLKGHIWFMTGMSYTIHFIQKVMKVFYYTLNVDARSTPMICC